MDVDGEAAAVKVEGQEAGEQRVRLACYQLLVEHIHKSVISDC
jgi:hypothetical protein